VMLGRFECAEVKELARELKIPCRVSVLVGSKVNRAGDVMIGNVGGWDLG